MAELIALGAAAAGLQLVQFTWKVATAAPAPLSRIRNYSGIIQDWKAELTTVKQLLGEVDSKIEQTNTSVTNYLDACRVRVSRLELLLSSVCIPEPQAKSKHLCELDLVLRKRATIEQQFASLRDTVHMLGSAVILQAQLSHVQPKPVSINNRSTVKVQTARLNLLARDALSLLSHFHHTDIPTTVLSIIIDDDYLDEVLTDLQARSLLTIKRSTDTLTIDPMEWQRQRQQTTLVGAMEPSRHLPVALATLDDMFPDSFPDPASLHRSSSLERHVASVLQQVLDLTPTLADINSTARLALRFCMHTVLYPGGGHEKASTFISRYFTWSRSLLPENSEAYIALASTRSALELLRGSSQRAYSLSLSVVRNSIRVYGRSAMETSHGYENLAHVCQVLGYDKRGLVYLRKAFEIRQKLHAEDTLDNFVSVSHLGVGLQPAGYYSQRSDQSLTGWMNMLEPDTEVLLAARSNMGIAICYQGHLDEAEAIHEYVYGERCRMLGGMHHETLKSGANLADLKSKRGDHIEAEAGYRKVLRRMQRSLGQSHADVLKTRTNLARVLFDQARYADADAMLVETLPLLATKFGARHRDVLEAQEFRTTLLHYQQNFAAARSVASELFESRLLELGIKHSDTQRILRYIQGLGRDLPGI